jgi:hypothetical protein
MMATTTRRLQTERDPMQANDMRNSSRRADVAPDEIARRAYELYEQRGGEPGHELDDWLRAENDVQQRLITE